MQAIYRLETDSGQGPYGAYVDPVFDDEFCGYHIAIYDTYENNRSHYLKDGRPIPDQDTFPGVKGKGYFYRDGTQWHCGFNSLDQLKAWFSSKEGLLAMEAHGMKISVYESEDFHVGLYQTMFRKDESIKVKTITVNEAFQ